jgi:hypothetical protein
MNIISKKTTFFVCSVAILVMRFVLIGVIEGAPAELPVTGRILEACSCAIPCTCNFGQAPSPHAFCEYLAVFEFTGGDLNRVHLAGLRMAMSSDRFGKNIVYVDAGAPAESREALTKIARWVLSLENKQPTGLEATPIELSLHDAAMTASLVEGNAQISARPLVGNDGKSPLVVTQPVLFGQFPVTRSRKAAASHLLVRSSESSFEYHNTNANDAVFEFLPSHVR